MEAEENNMNGETSRSSKEEDHISRLPDEILLQILSIYPFTPASQTIALLTGLWNRPFLRHEKHTQDFECAVGELLHNFDDSNPLKNPRSLEFHFIQGPILLATIGLNKKLHLDFSKSKMDFPRQFGGSVVLNTLDYPHTNPYPFHVKILKLTSMNYLTSEIVSSLVLKFRFVTSLIIEKCHGLRSLRIQALVRLVNLTVRDCPELKSLYVEALELHSLHCRGPLFWFSLQNVRYLEDVMLDFKQGPGYKYFEYEHYDSLLRAIRDVEVFTLHGWMFEGIIGPWLSLEKHEQLRFSKLQDLWWMDSSMEDYKINALLSFLKFCPSLKRVFVNIDPKSYSMPRKENSNEVQKGGRLRKLKVVKLEGFTNEDDTICLKERLMEVFNVEPRVVVVKKGSKSRCLIRIPKRQKSGNLKKGARELQKWKFCYKFVEEVEDNVGLCSKHAHM